MIGEYNCLCKLEIITSVIELNLVHGANGKAWWNSNKLQRKIITELPTDKNTQFLFSVANDIGIIPAYSKGICISFEDGVIISISADNFLYIGYRSNGNWIVKQIK